MLPPVKFANALRDLCDSTAGEVIVSVVAAALSLVSVRAVAGATPRQKQVLGVTAAGLLVVVVMLSDLPFGPSEGAKFWRDHALFTGVFTSVVLLGAGYLVIEQSIEKQRRSALGGQLNHMSRLGLARIIAEHVPLGDTHSWLVGIEAGEPDVGEIGAALRGWLRQQAEVDRGIRSLEMWFIVFVNDRNDAAHTVSEAVLKHRNQLDDYRSAVDLLISDLSDWATSSGYRSASFTNDLVKKLDAAFVRVNESYKELNSAVAKAQVKTS